MADLRLGSIKPPKMYLGSTAVSKVYLGTTLLWSSEMTWATFVSTFASTVEGDDQYSTGDSIYSVCYEMYDRTIYSSSDSDFCFAIGYDGETWIGCYPKSQYTSLLNNLSSFTYIGTYDEDSLWDGEYYKHTYYLGIPSFDDEQPGGGVIDMYRYDG